METLAMLLIGVCAFLMANTIPKGIAFSVVGYLAIKVAVFDPAMLTAETQPATQAPTPTVKNCSDIDEKQLRLAADCYAKKHGLDPLLVRAVVRQESAWNPNALSHAGAAGLMQLMPATAKSECGLSASERYDVHKNLDCGAYYLAKQLQRFGNIEFALCAYNAGPHRVNQLGRCPNFKETQDYVARITAHYAQLQQGQMHTAN